MKKTTDTNEAPQSTPATPRPYSKPELLPYGRIVPTLQTTSTFEPPPPPGADPADDPDPGF